MTGWTEDDVAEAETVAGVEYATVRPGGDLRVVFEHGCASSQVRELEEIFSMRGCGRLGATQMHLPSAEYSPEVRG